MTIPDQFLDEVRARVSVSSVVSPVVKLTKAGREWKGCCPFHNEKTPSFYVNDDKAFYHCFGCGAHGDVIRFLCEQAGLPFPDAVKELAQQGGLQMPSQDPRDEQKRQRHDHLHKIMGDVAAWYAANLALPEAAAARAYIEQRGIGHDTGLPGKFGIGYAPNSRTALRTAFPNVDPKDFIACGMMGEAESDQRLFERFSGRLMFPIRDPRGRVIGFGGRILGAGEPKYLNSPDTTLFDKGRSLFNMDLAGPAARKAIRLIVVEGYMDVVAMTKAGIPETVAPNGTALTEWQLEALWRVNSHPVLCFDGDKAGRGAARRAIHRAIPELKAGRTLSIAFPPEGMDPDDVLKRDGPMAIEALIGRAIGLADALVMLESADYDLDSPDGMAAFRSRMGRLTAQIRDREVRPEYESHIKGKIDALRRKNRPETGQSGQNRANPNNSGHPGAVSAKKLDQAVVAAVLTGLLRFPAVAVEMIEKIAMLRVSDPSMDRLRQHIVGIAASQTAPETQDAWEAELITLGAGEMLLDLQGRAKLPFRFVRSSDPDAAQTLRNAINEL